MGSRRRPPSHIHTAAALPQSRLPLGTPSSTQLSFPRLEHDNSSFSSSASTSPTKAHSAALVEKPSSNKQHSRMAPNPSSQQPQPHKSIADAKLERQRKRIEEADAAFRATINPAANATRKQAKNNENQKPHPQDAVAPVSEVRISSIRVVSRESSLARPISVVSSRTNDTAASDHDARDGFQVIRGRRNRKDELNASRDKPEPRQTTVEATFDKRDIYETFGNALPAPEFIEENPGSKNGQLQFIQHPNGDVSAHQWSNERFMWENIGQFSNIRKKVEGQLASDRLKGETAHQTLQQNTLTYFRTIAKQREAQAMGLPFGPKEIQAAMPAPPPKEVSTAPTGPKEPVKESTPSRPTAPTNVPYEERLKPADPGQPTMSGPSLYSAQPQAMPQFRVTDGFTYTPSRFQPAPRYQEDPFYLASPYRQIYRSYPQYVQQTPNPIIVRTPTSGASLGATAQSQLNYDFHFPPPGTTSRTASTQPSQSRMGSQSFQPDSATQSSIHDTAIVLPGNLRYRPVASYTTGYPSVTQHNILLNDPYLSRLDTPQGNRASMSDQLWKISETAKERNLSQPNISRTVLYDPYQKNPSVSTASRSSEIEKVEELSALSKSVAQSNPCPAAPPHYYPVPTDSTAKPSSSSQSHGPSTVSLQDSSPDTYWSKKPYDHSTPLMTASTQTQATPQNFNGPFFPADKKKTSISSVSKKTYDEELNDWWTSGNKFARQEEFYQSIANAHKSTTITTSPPHLNPIVPPSRTTPIKHAPAPFNPTTTRLLIPVLENLASYVQGPMEKRRDYFCPWSTAPEWAIDRSESGNDSFFDKDWGTPPSRVGRDPRYAGQRLEWSQGKRTTPTAGRFTLSSPLGGQGVGTTGYAARIMGGVGLSQRFGVGVGGWF